MLWIHGTQTERLLDFCKWREDITLLIVYGVLKKEVIIQKNDRRVEQINLFVCICPDVYWITEIFLFLFGAGRCNGNFGGSGKPDDLKYSIYSYSYYTVKMENPL